MDCNSAYLYHCRTLAEVERVEVVKCRDSVYKRDLERFSVVYCVTNTQGMSVVVRHNMRGVPV
jgi:hypothetical protein